MHQQMFKEMGHTPLYDLPHPAAWNLDVMAVAPAAILDCEDKIYTLAGEGGCRW